MHTHLNGGRGLVNSGPSGGYESGWVESYDTDVALTYDNLACYPNNSSWTAAAGSQEDLPIFCVNWYEAYAFCIWDGGFLPSEAEWEYVAAGGSQQRKYPWGSTEPGTDNQYAIYDCDYPSGPNSCLTTNIANLAPVGTATQGAGLWAQLDMAGELWEWNLDVYANTYVDPCTNCAYLTPPSIVGNLEQVGRGGEFEDPAQYLLPSWARLNESPSSRTLEGIRCARAP